MMGQDSSSPISEASPPSTLSARTLAGVASYMTSPRCRKVVIMAGAGISTSAGIPDFRSPDTGLYSNLARLNLPFVEAVFDISFFRQDPKPFYTLARELYPGKFHPTVTHAFFRLLHDKGLLLKLFTQNIDCLERRAGVPDTHIVEAHGSFARQRCIDCRTLFPDDEMRAHVLRGDVPRCIDTTCNGLVKPDIVFFGEQLPAAFHDARHLPAEADLCIVLGTSLTVQPFASLPGFCAEGVPRVLVNKERVGGLGTRADDVLLLGDCDQGVRRLAEACGWGEELEALWRGMNAETAAAPAAAGAGEEAKADGGLATADTAGGADKSGEEALEDEVEKLTKEVEETLALSKRHVERIRGEHDAEDDSNKVNGTATKTDLKEGEVAARDSHAPAHKEETKEVNKPSATNGILDHVEAQPASPTKPSL